MKRLIKALLRRVGWKIVRADLSGGQSHGLPAFFYLLKSLGFSPKHIVDVGANHGGWTRTAVEYFPSAKYTLIEPQAQLRASIQDLIDKGVDLHWISSGAGDRSGELAFTVALRDDSSCFVRASNEVRPETASEIVVPVRPLNELVMNTGCRAPNLVKVDAEGFDLRVLDGASQLLGKTEVILVEVAVCEPHFENTTAAVILRMSEAGYKLFDITDLNREPKHRALWLCEFAFILRDSSLLGNLTSYE